MSEELKNQLKRIKQEEKQRLQEWLTKFEEITQVAPFVQQAYEQVQWDLDVMNTMPRLACDILPIQLADTYSRGQEFWGTALPSLPSHDETFITTGSAVTAAEGTATYDFVLTANELGDPMTQSWARSRLDEYKKIQTNQDRIEKIRNILRKFNPDRVQEFDDAIKVYRLAVAKGSDAQSVGIHLRNVIEHVKGELWQKARTPREQKFKWSIVADRLSKGLPNGLESQTLLHEGEGWDRFHRDRLTPLAKNLQIGGIDLETIFAEWVARLYTVLLLINPTHYS